MKINYSLVGMGGIARVHLMGLRNIPLMGLKLDADINLTGLLTTHTEKNSELARGIGFENVVGSIEDLVKIPDLDVIDICTPNYLHKEQIMTAIEANKHVYCEKPLALNRDHAIQIMDTLEKNYVHNQMGFVLRFLPSVMRARAMLKNNILGKIYAIRGELYHSSYLNPQKKLTWRLNQQRSGGGALADLGSHMIDLVHFLLGEIETIQAWTDTIVTQRPTDNGELRDVDVDDWALLMVKLKNGVKGTVEASRVAVGNDGTRLEIYGEKGSICIDPDNTYFPRFVDNRSKPIDAIDELIDDEEINELLKIYPTPKLSQGWMIDVHTASLACFLKTVTTNSKPSFAPDFREGYKTQEVVDCAYRSSEENSLPVNIDYQRRGFEDDKGNNI